MFAGFKHVPRRMRPREQTILEIAAGKRVVHYGAVGDDPRIQVEKARRGAWLHANIQGVAASVVGIDVDREAVEIVRDELGVTDIYFGNIEDSATFEADAEALQQAEVVLALDVIEHLHDLRGFFLGLRSAYSPDTHFFISTPNPFAWYNTVSTLANKELYSPYHTMHFSIQNMRVLLDHMGFDLVRAIPIHIVKEGQNPLVRGFDAAAGTVAMWISPGFSDSFMYEAVMRPGGPDSVDPLAGARPSIAP